MDLRNTCWRSTSGCQSPQCPQEARLRERRSARNGSLASVGTIVGKQFPRGTIVRRNTTSRGRRSARSSAQVVGKALLPDVTQLRRSNGLGAMLGLGCPPYDRITLTPSEGFRLGPLVLRLTGSGECSAGTGVNDPDGSVEDPRR